MTKRATATTRRRGNKYGAQAVYACDRCMQTITNPDNHPSSCAGEPVRFHSKTEARYWLVLRVDERAGVISGLKRQAAFPLYGAGPRNGKPVTTYFADFVYFDSCGDYRVIDVKGQDTRVSQLKRGFLQAEYGVTVELVTKGQGK